MKNPTSEMMTFRKETGVTKRRDMENFIFPVPVKYMMVFQRENYSGV